jgi:dienelactone hydrolase
MFRYIIGVTLIAAAIMLIRRLADGRMLKRHQYALWLLIPLYMLISPFLKISVPVADEISSLIPAAFENAVYDNTYIDDVVPFAELEKDDLPEVLFEQGEVQEQAEDTEVLSNNAASVRTVKKHVNIGAVLNGIYVSVTAAAVIALTVYNAGFIIFCRRKSTYLGTDPKSGLKVYAISHRGVPFLLFNGIYVDPEPSRTSEYAICHEACHFKHGDFVWVILRHLVLALNWYNPVIWAAFILSGRDCELACDEEVVSVYGKDHAETYAEALVMQMQRKSEFYRFTMTTGMRSGYKSMRRRIVSIKHPAKKSFKAIAMSLAALIVISGFAVLEPKAAESDQSIIDELVNEAVIEAPVKREAPFDYEIRKPAVSQVSSYEKDITFFRDDNAVKAKMLLPEGSGPFKTVVMRGELGSTYYEYQTIADALKENGYAVLFVKNTHESEIIRRSGGSGVKTVADVYFEQVLDHFAVIDEMRYIPEIDMDNIYLWGHDLGGVISLYTGVERQDEIKGMVIVQPYLNENQALKFSEDPELMVRLYEILPDCTVPTAILEPENSPLSASKRATESMPDGRIVLFEGSLSKFDRFTFNNIDLKTLSALKDM